MPQCYKRLLEFQVAWRQINAARGSTVKFFGGTGVVAVGKTECTEKGRYDSHWGCFYFRLISRWMALWNTSRRMLVMGSKCPCFEQVGQPWAQSANEPGVSQGLVVQSSHCHCAPSVTGRPVGCAAETRRISCWECCGTRTPAGDTWKKSLEVRQG